MYYLKYKSIMVDHFLLFLVFNTIESLNIRKNLIKINIKLKGK